MNQSTKPYSWVRYLYSNPSLYIYQAGNAALLPRSKGEGYGYEWDYNGNHGFIGTGYSGSHIHFEQYYNLPPNWDQT